MNLTWISPRQFSSHTPRKFIFQNAQRFNGYWIWRPYGFLEVHTALDGPRINQSNREFRSCYTIICSYWPIARSIRENIWTAVLKYGPNEVRSVRRTKVPIFPVWTERTLTILSFAGPGTIKQAHSNLPKITRKKADSLPNWEIFGKTFMFQERQIVLMESLLKLRKR